MNNPLLSILVLTYNQENFIAQTLDSIIEQEHDYSYEIIVGDDYSTDYTRNILLEYKEKYPEIITLLLNEKNQGLIKNYFNVVSHCTGKYMMQCAGDDYWLPEKVKTQIIFMENNPDIVMCSGNANILYENGEIGLMGTKYGLIDFISMIENNRIIAVTVCIKTEILTKYIVDIDPVNKNWLMEDYPIWLYLTIKNYKVYNLEEVFAVYRFLSTSLSNIKNYEKQKLFLESVFDIKSFYITYDKNYFYLENKLDIQKKHEIKILKRNYYNKFYLLYYKCKIFIKNNIKKYPFLFKLFLIYKKIKSKPKMDILCVKQY